MNRRHRGFTLLEMLVAIGMSAIIAGSLATSLYVGFRARTSAERAVEEAHVSDAIGDIVAREIATALPPTGIMAGSFTGAADSIAFYCPGPEPKAEIQSNCRYVEYSLSDDGALPDQHNLIRKVNTNLLAPVEEEP